MSHSDRRAWEEGAESPHLTDRYPGGVMSHRRVLMVASGSPRRRQLLEMILGTVDIDPADIDETPAEGESADDLVVRLAMTKADTVADRHPGRTVLGLAARDPQASLNLLLHDGTRIVGITWGDPASYLVTPQGIAVASEPWDDDPAWIDVPDRHLIEVTSAGVNLTSLA